MIDVPPEQIRSRDACAPARCCWSTPGGPHRRRRGDQDRDGAPVALRPLAGTQRLRRRATRAVHGLQHAAQFPDVEPPRSTPPAPSCERLQRAFGYTDEDERLIIDADGRDGKEPTGSMGSDTPLACLVATGAEPVELLSSAVRAGHQSAIDPIRESLVMTPRDARSVPTATASRRRRTTVTA